MTAYILTDAVLRDGDAVDIEIRDGRIDRVVPSGDGDVSAFDADQQFDAAGRLVTPPFAEPHTHLVTANTFAEFLRTGYEMPRPDRFGVGWQMYDDLQEFGMIDPEAIVERASTQIEWFLAHGVTTIRTHVDTSARHENALVDGLVNLRKAYEGIVDIQIVGLPLDTLVGSDANIEALRDALETGADVVGGIPHKEATREDGVEHVKTIVDLADSYDRPLDPHIDESDDPQSRFTGVMAAEVEKQSLETSVTASHLTAMHSYPNAYADKLRGLLARNDISVVTNPTTNAELQGRRDDYPRRRGHTRVDELLEAGVTVGIGQDNMVDKYHPYGDCDPLGEVLFLAHFGHLTSWYDVPTLWEMVLEHNASILDIDGYGLQPGSEGSFVLFDAPDSYNALRTRAPRRLVVRNGTPVARRESGTTEVRTGDEWSSVDFSVPLS